MKVFPLRSEKHLSNPKISLSSHGRQNLILTDKNGSGKTTLLLVLEGAELWTYFGESFHGKDKVRKKIRKAGSKVRYEAAVREVFGTA